MNPPAIMSTPRRLSGRRHQATSPAATYGTLIHSSSRTWMPLTSSFVIAERERAAGRRQSGRRDGLQYRELWRFSRVRDHDWCYVGHSHAGSIPVVAR